MLHLFIYYQIMIVYIFKQISILERFKYIRETGTEMYKVPLCVYITVLNVCKDRSYGI